MSTQKLIREIERLVGAFEKTPGGHLKPTRPDADHPVFVASTTASERAWQQMLAEMRRALRREAGR